MKKEKIKVVIEVTSVPWLKDDGGVKAERVFEVEASRALLFRSLEAIERRLTKLYPVPESPPKVEPLP